MSYELYEKSRKTICDLTDEHRSVLIDNHAIKPEYLAGIRSWGVNGNMGIVIPWNDGVTSYDQFRLDPSKREKFPNIPKCFGPEDVMVVNHLREPAGPDDALVIVEGTLQHRAVASWLPENYGVYGIYGCNGYVGQDLSTAEDRDVYVFFDADMGANRDVWNAARKLQDALKAEGAKSIKFVMIPGKSKDGADDVLARRQPEKRSAFLLRLIEQATDDIGNQPTKKRASNPVETTPDDSNDRGRGLRFFNRIEGRNQLMATELARAVTEISPLAQGIDDQMWSYQEGVWKPSAHVVRDRVARLMGDIYRPTYVPIAEDIIKSTSPTIVCDPVPNLINFRNGLLDWRTGELRDHSSDVLSTVQLPIEWNPDAECPEVEKWLGEAVPADMVELVWELIGYLMMSGNPLQKAVLLTGHGGNGKGVLIRLVKALLGHESISAVSLHGLSERFMPAQLFGKLANICGDIDAKFVENTADFKKITGDDAIEAERKNRDPFTFVPWAVPLFSANKIPASIDVTKGYFRRWLVIPFPNDFSDRNDPGFESRLHNEIEGVAARAIPALRRLMDRGAFELTESAKSAQSEFERRVDQVRYWLDEDEKVCRHESHWTYRTDLYKQYEAWAKNNNVGVLKTMEFYDRLEAAGMRPSKVKGTRGFAGIALDCVMGHDSETETP